MILLAIIFMCRTTLYTYQILFETLLFYQASKSDIVVILALFLLFVIIIPITYRIHKVKNIKKNCNAVRDSDSKVVLSMLKKGIDINKQFGASGSTA